MGDKSHSRISNWDSPAAERFATSHLNLQSPLLNEQLAQSLQNGRAKNFPDWAATPSQGKFLMLQCRMLGVKNVLELGTLGGQGTIWCASANKDIKITTIEMRPKYAAVARENLLLAGLEERVELIEGKAQEVMSQLALEISLGSRPKFGLVYVDVEAYEETWELLDIAIGLCCDLGCIIAHCGLRPSDFSVHTSDEKNGSARGSRGLIEKVGKDKRVDAVLLMTDGEQRYDTLIAAVRATE